MPRRLDFASVQAVLRGEHTAGFDPRAAKTLGLLAGYPQDAFLSATGFRAQLATASRTAYFSYVGAMIVGELMRQLDLHRIDGPVTGEFTQSYFKDANTSRHTAAVWIVPSDDTVRLACRRLPNAAPPADRRVPDNGPWKLPELFERGPRYPRRLVENPAAISCPACGVVSPQLRLLDDGGFVCIECEKPFPE